MTMTNNYESIGAPKVFDVQKYEEFGPFEKYNFVVIHLTTDCRYPNGVVYPNSASIVVIEDDNSLEEGMVRSVENTFYNEDHIGQAQRWIQDMIPVFKGWK